MATERAASPQAEWQSLTLASLAKNSKRGGRLPTPSYRKPGGNQPIVGPNANRSRTMTCDTDEGPEKAAPGSKKDEGLSGEDDALNWDKIRREGIKRLEDKTYNFLPDVKMVIERLKAGAEGFSESEVDRMNGAFQRFKDPDSPEIHKDELKMVLSHLGYSQIDPDQVKDMADNITTFPALEKPDFMSFMEKHAEFERHRFKEIFERYDADGSGYLDTEELITFLTSLGFTPLRSMVKEALDMVDLDGNGTLDFEEVVVLMHVYKHSEGFTLAQIQEISSIFANIHEESNVVSPPGRQPTMPADKLSDLLVTFFGPASAKNATALTSEMAALHLRGEDKAHASNNGVPLGLNFHEALTWARRIRDKEFDSYREAFEKFDEDNSNSIDMNELKKVIQTLGFTMSMKSIEEFISHAKSRGDMSEQKGEEEESMDYDAFVHFMQILQESDGFNRAEMTKILGTFNRFDEDGSGDIDIIELSDMLRDMGHIPRLDVVRKLHAQVDFNGSGALDHREFVRFMRLHREHQLEEIRDVFEAFQDKEKKHDEEEIHQDVTQRAIQALADGEEKDEGVKTDVKAFITGHALDFDAFVDIGDQIRAMRVIENKKRAGFGDDELGRFKEVFEHYDSKKTGHLNLTDATALLIELGFNLRTVDEQKELKKSLAQARQLATEANADVGDEGTVSFWVIVQLLRALYRKDDQSTELRLSRVAEEAKFSATEVTEFQEVFNGCWERDAVFEEGGGAGSNRKRLLSKSSLSRLLRTMGMKLNGEQREMLDNKVTELCSNENVDFPGFLLIMRWMIETNFGG
eukprot:CAMPEP_0115089938 /NCGR_PEP_ID=MMETSP0227-20121206/25064_1 /TAXON_ID=89957 /ORGANISM="Polarella glacialis, Strain CCMP 1383" /LENGTH=804 /DNA_ID=CAMNT_0002480853 /DNA_START=52 /DNA_END=2463 /DNA_ORIENTATION=-